MNVSLNNLLVENLKTGKGGSIKTLLEMGQGPFVTLDYVERSSDIIHQQGSQVATQTIWFWIHQAPIADAVEFCWSHRLERQLSGLSPSARASLLTNAMEDAAHAALSSQHAEAWLHSWERVQSYVKPFDADALLDRQGLLNGVKNMAIQYGDSSAFWLLAMNHAGFLVRPDVQRWFSDGFSLGEVIQKAYPELLQALLDIGDRPVDLLQCTQKAEESLLLTLLEGSQLWEHDQGFGRRQFTCLKVLVSHWEDPRSYQVSAQLRQTISGLDVSAWRSEELAGLKDFLLETGLEAPVKKTASSRRRL